MAAYIAATWVARDQQMGRSGVGLGSVWGWSGVVCIIKRRFWSTGVCACEEKATPQREGEDAGLGLTTQHAAPPSQKRRKKGASPKKKKNRRIEEKKRRKKEKEE